MSHWYDNEGKPQHFTTMANGKSRDTNLRDARKHGYFPSVTEIINTIDKPALNRWKGNQILLAALTLPKIENEPLDEFSSRVMADAFKESTEARDRGSDIHDAIESAWKGKHKNIPHDLYEFAEGVTDRVTEYCGTDRFTAEATAVGDGYGGMIDLHNDAFLIDYKTKDIKDVTAKLAYPEMAMQLAAYDEALGVHQGRPRRLINVFVDRKEPGKVVIYEWSEEDAVIAWKKFQLLVAYWQLSKNYYPVSA